MIFSRFLALTLVFCGTFMVLNAFLKEKNDIRELLNIFRGINETPPAFIKRLEEDLAEGKTTYSANELSGIIE